MPGNCSRHAAGLPFAARLRVAQVVPDQGEPYEPVTALYSTASIGFDVNHCPEANPRQVTLVAPVTYPGLRSPPSPPLHATPCQAPVGRLQSLTAVLSETAVRELLNPFSLALTAHQIDQLLTYLKLMLHWNRKINLTSIRSPEECVTRHFGESLYLAQWVELDGRLLDIGSGAGFPGLALKIAFPRLSATLLEPSSKKRAFLKEVARACGMNSVEVRPERLEDFLSKLPSPSFDAACARAVGKLNRLVPCAAQSVKPGGHVCLWLSEEQAKRLPALDPSIVWRQVRPVPLSKQRVILVGERALRLA